MNTRFYWVQTFRHGSFVMLLASLLAIIPATHASAQTLGNEDAAAICTVQDDLDISSPHVDTVCLAAVDAAGEEASGWPDFDPSSLGDEARQIEQAKTEAAAEASSWPDFDPSSLGDRVQLVEAAGEEAAAWPDFDPSSLGDRIQLVEAAGEEAASWPDFDPSNIRLV